MIAKGRWALEQVRRDDPVENSGLTKWLVHDNPGIIRWPVNDRWRDEVSRRWLDLSTCCNFPALGFNVIEEGLDMLVLH